MIQADPSKAFNKWFLLYMKKYLLKRNLRSISIYGHIDYAVENNNQNPVLYIMNHSSWWDGLLLYYAAQQQSKRWQYVMMDEAQLRQYRFFSRLGAYSIDKTNGKAMIESLQYTADLLQRNERVWIFPQGDIHHLEKRPIDFQSGVGYVLQKAPHTIVVPVTAYYSLSPHQRADATLIIGNPLIESWDDMKRKEIAPMLSNKLEEQLDLHRSSVIASPGELLPGFEYLFAPTFSTNEVMDVFKRRVSNWKSYFGS